MTKPIAQTFIINEPATGVDVVFLTKLELFFRTKSDTFGVELQIRETDNGFPTRKIVPYGTRILNSDDVNTSTDASVATTFYFQTPVLLKTNEQYALVVVPIGGNPDYNVWVGEIGGTDVESQVPIYKNNDLGSLFISSNDLNFTPIQNESMKYNLYIAQFTQTSANAVFKNSHSDVFFVTDTVGAWIKNERVVMSNNELTLSALTISGSNTFTNGEIVFQPGGTVPANLTQATAYGTVYYSNTTTVLMNTTVGAFNTSDGIRGQTSNNAAAAPSFANQSIVTTNASNQIVVPNANSSLTTDFAVNNFIYVGKTDRSNVEVKRITSVNDATRTLTLDSNVNFSNSSAVIGRVKADAELSGVFTNIIGGDNKYIILTAVNSNSTQNFANSENYLLIGTTSGATSRIEALVDSKYESITSQIPHIDIKSTETTWRFKGTSVGNVTDTNTVKIESEIPFESTSRTRILKSRSNEIQNPASAGAGNSSLIITASLSTSNTKVSPYIDTSRSQATLTHNVVFPESYLNGYIVAYNNANGTFSAGDIIQQANTTVTSNAVVSFANSSTITVTNVVSSNSSTIATFNTSNTVIYNVTKAVSSTITAVRKFGETGNTSSSASRYISKNVILADQQDAEDLICYITAYRPANTDFKVYGRFLNGSDPDSSNSKDWSAMRELSDPALRSSLVNREDFVELVYDLPISQTVISGNAAGNTTSAVVNVYSTSAFSPGDFVYITESSSNKFNVRQVVTVNSTALTLSSNLSFASTSADVGRIPGLESQYGAFKYNQNNNIIRYTNKSDAVYETFKTFAVKIVLVAEESHIVPRMADMRCIALQV